MNNKEIIKSQEYQEYLKALDWKAVINPNVDQLLEYFKFQSNPKEAGYFTAFHKTYEILKNTYFFVELKSSQLIGMYTTPTGKDYFIRVDSLANIEFIGDSIINWTNAIKYIEKTKIKEFQEKCFYAYDIPTRLWNENQPTISHNDLTFDESSYLNDSQYINFIKSDMDYDTYLFLKTNASVSTINKKRLRLLVNTLTDDGKYLSCDCVDANDPKFRCNRLILDGRFLNGLNKTAIGFNTLIDIDIEYSLNEQGYINLIHIKPYIISLFNILRLLKDIKARKKIMLLHYTKFKLSIIAKILDFGTKK